MARKAKKPFRGLPTEERTTDLAQQALDLAKDAIEGEKRALEREKEATEGAASVAASAEKIADIAQEIVDGKLAEAKAPKPRRVGPLSKLERTLLEQANDAQAPLVAEHQRLAKRMGELRVAMAQRDRQVGQAILEGRGESLAREGEAVQLVEDGADVYVQVVAVKPTGRPS